MNNFMTRAELAKLLASKYYRFAKTMPDNPHYYSLRREWKNDELFDHAVLAIRHYGRIEMFRGWPYTCFWANGYKYWTMGDPLKTTYVLNRKLANYHSDYDEIADIYDSLYDAEFYKCEDSQVVQMIDYKAGKSLLDAGCGTGVLMEYMEPTIYVGVDRSKYMLSKFSEKHKTKEKVLINSTIEDFHTDARFDYVVSLYGSASYLTPLELDKLIRFVKTDGKLFLMLYRDSITPDLYKMQQITPAYNKLASFKTVIAHHKLHMQDFHNYAILTK